MSDKEKQIEEMAEELYMAGYRKHTKHVVPRYTDADALYRDAEKRIAEANKARMAVVDDEFLDLINDAYIEDDVVEVVRCKCCVFWRGKDHDGVCIENGLATRMANEFCSRGKKKGGESDDRN